MANQIMVIKPYKWADMWVFDDPAVGLEREPFVGGANILIDMGIEQMKIPDADKGFIMLFSKDPFPGAHMELEWLRFEAGGNIYRWHGKEGWLCPALFKYFEKAPSRIFMQVRPAAPANEALVR